VTPAPYRPILLLALIGALLAVTAVVGIPSATEARRALGTDSGWAPLLAVLGVATLALVMVPRSAVAVLGGVLFPPVEATAYVLAGVLAGGSVAFGIGRLLGREYVARLTSGRLATGRTARLDEWIGRNGFAAVVVTRLLPVLPFGLLNYGFGTTRVRYAVFLAGTAVGILPTTFLYATVGSAATDPASPTFLAATTASVALAVVAVVLVRRLRRGKRLVILPRP
jgi:uncharacterized membrane protein YdjX (TVP38/TMEM64 family)